MDSRRFFVVPHTHWDREWYAPFEYFHLRLAQVLDGVLDTLERDPRFTTFTLDGQAIVLEDYLDIRPENEGRLRALLEAGRLEVGPSYILPDEFLVGAEALVRNLLLGRAVCRRFGAEPSGVGYLPDSFGHPAQIPQILAGFGIDNMIYSRGVGDEFDEVGPAFRWRAPEGSEVIALLQLGSYGNFGHVGSGDEGERRVRGLLGQFGPALGAGDPILLCNGEDHSFIERELPRICAELEERFQGSRFTIARHSDYVDAMRGRELPAWQGELLGARLWNILRGVNSARLYLKQANERAEQRLLAVETLAALSALAGGDPFPQADFRLAWSALLRCHPHDSICGCSCDEVHRDMIVRYEQLERTLSVLERAALARLGCDQADGAGGRVGVVNLLPSRRQGLVDAPGCEPQLIELDGFSARTIELEPAGMRPVRRADERAIESDRLRVEAMHDGTLKVLDKRTGRVLQGLHALEDEADTGDLYNFCPVDGLPVWRARASAARVLRDGPLVWELEVSVQMHPPAGLDEHRRPLPDCVTLALTTVVRLARGSARVELRTTIDNPARDHRLRAVFPLGPADGPIRAEGQFAIVRRPLAPPPPRSEWVEPPDPTGHSIGAVALGPMALLTRGLPEYEARVGDGGAELCLTLLRCVGIISQATGAIATRPLGAGPGVATPEGQCIGRHELDYAVRLDADELDDTALLRESQDYRAGFLLVGGGVDFDAPLQLDGEVVFACLKGAEDGDGLILRCFSAAERPADVRVAGPAAPSLARTRLDETGEEPLDAGALTVSPGEIATVRLRVGARPTEVYSESEA